jgi:outer membrane protein OmpA-like peptidoglycan-associated protein
MRSRAAIIGLLMMLSSASVAVAQQTGGGDTRRRTIAVTYPDKGRIRVVLAGTPRTPRANGAAEVRRMRGLTQVEIELDDMVPAYLLGADYTTYVMWAITPEGQIENLGEFRLNGSRSKLRATTRFETFALLVTAEPHLAVQKPSRVVVLENVPPKGPGVMVQSAEIYFTGDTGRYLSNSDLPEVVQKDWAKQPLELLGARRAVEIAKLAGAEQHASRAYAEAQDSFQKAEAAYLAGDRASAELLGRKSIRLAERARELSEERAEAARERELKRQTDETIRDLEVGARQYLDQIDDLKGELKVSESARTRAEDEAERAHEEAATLRVTNRSLQGQVDQLTSQVRQLEEQLSQLERARQADAAANQRAQAYQTLNEMLRPLATVQSDSRGFKVVLPDSLFAPQKGALRESAASKLNPIAAILIAHPTVEFLVESYTDDRGAPEALMQLSDERAQAIAAFLTNAGVSAERYMVTG